MSFFTQHRVRQETAFDRKARAIMRSVVMPTTALVVSFVVFILCGWGFLVVFAGWPRPWAATPFVLSAFFAPALAFVSLRELWRVGWDTRMFFAALLSVAGFAFWCATIYFVIHGKAA